MPIIDNGDNKIVIDYEVPKEKQNLVTKIFLIDFLGFIDKNANIKMDYTFKNYFNFIGCDIFKKSLEEVSLKYNFYEEIFVYFCFLDDYDRDMMSGYMLEKAVIFNILKDSLL